MNKEKKEIILIGGGGHCHSVIDVIEVENKFTICGIIDKKEMIGKKILSYPIIGTDNDLEILRKKYQYAFVTVGHIKSNNIRVKLFNILETLNYEIPIIKSPLAYVSKHTKIEKGTIIMHHSLINTNAKIGKNCIINSKALIEHDVIIENNSHISTGAIINGGTLVKENTFIGSNSVSKEYIEINSFVKAGSLVK